MHWTANTAWKERKKDNLWPILCWISSVWCGTGSQESRQTGKSTVGHEGLPYWLSGELI